MKLHVTIDGAACLLEIDLRPGESAYRLEGSVNASGTASIAQIAPELFSILLDQRSYRVHVKTAESGELLVASGNQTHTVTILDPRDRSAQSKKQVLTGPVEVRAQMPGKVVKLLVQPGARVEAGASLIVVEAMKMQNEMKSPKAGEVIKIYVAEGATVSAGERLLAVE